MSRQIREPPGKCSMHWGFGLRLPCLRTELGWPQFHGGTLTFTLLQIPGGTWTATTLSANNLSCVASSSGGTKLATADGVSTPGSVFTSANSGATWIETSSPSDIWFSVASSADGTK